MDVIISTAPTPNVEAQLVCANSSNLTTVALTWMVRHNGIVTIVVLYVMSIVCVDSIRCSTWNSISSSK